MEEEVKPAKLLDMFLIIIFKSFQLIQKELRIQGSQLKLIYLWDDTQKKNLRILISRSKSTSLYNNKLNIQTINLYICIITCKFITKDF